MQKLKKILIFLAAVLAAGVGAITNFPKDAWPF